MHTFWLWFLLFLLIAFTLALVISVGIATKGRGYVNLDIVLFFGLLTGYLWVVWAALSYRQTIYVQLLNDFFLVKKAGRQPARYPYAAILTHNERYDSGRGNPFNELTIYLADNWFALRSNQFTDYDSLRDLFTHYGQPVPYRDVLTPAERNWLRWMIVGVALLIGVVIVFGFVMHNPADPNPARLISLTDTVEQVRENKVKGRLTGVTLSLWAFPRFSFDVSRRDYTVRLDSLASAITPNRPITLLIRQSDFRKKLRGTEPLTFGDKYDGYSRILVFGITQGNSVRIQTPNPIYEPTHTNPLLRTFLLSILLLLCWTGWVYVDRQPVLRGGPTGRH